MEQKTGLELELEIMDFYFSKQGDSPLALFTINYSTLETFRRESLRKNIIARINRISPDINGKTGPYYVHNDRQDFSPDGLELARRYALEESQELYNLSELKFRVMVGKDNFLKNFTDNKEQIYRICYPDLINCLVQIAKNQKD